MQIYQTNYQKEIAELYPTKIDYLQTYGKKHWIVLKKFWQNYSGRFETDIILFTQYKGYVIEIKNYKGEYSYNDGIIKINGRIRSANPFHQARRAYTNLENICLDHSYPTKFQGIVIFAGQLSRSYLTKIIKKNFEVIENGSHSYIINKKFPFPTISKQFKF